MNCFDLRVYDVATGELETLERILRDLALPMMPDHGIRPVGFWSDPDDNKLYQVSRHASRDAVAENWKRFHADPRWATGLKDRRGDRTVVRGVATTILAGISGMPPTDAADKAWIEETP